MMQTTNTAQPNCIAEDAITRKESYGYDSKGKLDWRRKAIKEAQQMLLGIKLPDSPELLSLVGSLRQSAHQITQHLWHLLAQLEESESAKEHIYEELEWTRERLSELPPFQYDEPKYVAKAREGIEQLRSRLGQELRDTSRRWLETRGDAESAIAEVFNTYCESITKIGSANGQEWKHPELGQVLQFLNEPPSQDVIIKEQPITINDRQVRIP